MNIKRCGTGHYFDGDKYAKCPHCDIRKSNAGETVSIDDIIRDAEASKGKTLARPFKGNDPMREAKTQMHRGDEANRTIGIFKKQAGMDPAVGWLVCVEGPERGRDYRLHVGRNFIGRSPSMDVYVSEDRCISKLNHASIVYEPRRSEFFLVSGDGETLSLNGVRVIDISLLKDADEIVMGESRFVFVAFCKGGFKWL